MFSSPTYNCRTSCPYSLLSGRQYNCYLTFLWGSVFGNNWRTEQLNEEDQNMLMYIRSIQQNTHNCLCWILSTFHNYVWEFCPCYGPGIVSCGIWSCQLFNVGETGALWTFDGNFSKCGVVLYAVTDFLVCCYTPFSEESEVKIDGQAGVTQHMLSNGHNLKARGIMCEAQRARPYCALPVWSALHQIVKIT